MCCDSIDGNPEDKVGECPECGAGVDEDGESVEEMCRYSPECGTCGDSPCDQSC